MKQRKISVVLVLLLSAIGMEAFAHNAEVNNLNEQPTTESMVIANTEFVYTNSDEVNGYACLADKKYHLHRELNNCINEYDKGINSLPYDAQFDLKSLVETHIVNNQAGTDQRIDEDLFSSMNLAYRFYPIDYSRDGGEYGPIETLFLTLTGKDELGYYNGIGYFNQVRENIVEGKRVGEKIKGENPFGGEYRLANHASLGRQPIVRVELYSKNNPEMVYAAGYLKLEISEFVEKVSEKCDNFFTCQDVIVANIDGSEADNTIQVVWDQIQEHLNNLNEGECLSPKDWNSYQVVENEQYIYDEAADELVLIDKEYSPAHRYNNVGTLEVIQENSWGVHTNTLKWSFTADDYKYLYYDLQSRPNGIDWDTGKSTVDVKRYYRLTSSDSSLPDLYFGFTIPAGKLQFPDNVFDNLPYDAEINGIYYNFWGYQATVTSTKSGASYTGNVVIPSHVTYNGTIYKVTGIGNYAFYGCSGLTSITIGNSVTSIGKRAFHHCSGLTSVTIPNSVASIGEGAFSGCSGLTSVTIPNSVTSIGDYAFSYCSGLTSVTIPNSVTSIGSDTFYICSGLTSVTIPNSVTSIGRSAFYGCSGLTSVTIPNSVTSIGDYAFYPCSRLTSITIPNSVISIGRSTFSGCSGLNSIVVDANNTVYDSRNECNAIVETATNTLLRGSNSTVIPTSVTSIGEYAFHSCSGLTSITIPNSVTSIGDYAFAFCYGLTSVTIDNRTPLEINSNTFKNVSNSTLYVPFGCKSDYEEADVWRDFEEIVEIDLESSYDITNVLELENASVVQGGWVTVPVGMTNEDDITAFQFELRLPKGFSVQDATLTARKSNHTMSYSLLENGNYQFAAFSLNARAFNGNEGALVNVTLKANSTVTPSDYTIEVKNIELTTTDEQACVPANCSATLTVSDIKVGDANGDGKISITDAVAVVNKLLGKPSVNFRADAADVTGDGKITITDAVAIVNIVLGKRPANARGREPQ